MEVVGDGGQIGEKVRPERAFEEGGHIRTIGLADRVIVAIGDGIIVLVPVAELQDVIAQPRGRVHDPAIAVDAIFSRAHGQGKPSGENTAGV